MVFGFLLAAEGFGAILTGWVKRTFIDPKFTFNFMGFDWLQPLPGNGMYVYFIILGVLGLMVMLGYRYYLAITSYAIMWAGVYFMQKTSYNNHYYLLLIILFIMILLPANRGGSLDSIRKPSIRKNYMPNWCKWLIVSQLFIVYTYATVAKLYPDWLDLSVVKGIFHNRVNIPLLKDLFKNHYFHFFITYAGMLFDLLVIPLLLWKPTRKYIFAAAVFFHLFNSIFLKIGIFPYLALAFCFFFFEAKTLRNIFYKKYPILDNSKTTYSETPKWLIVFLSIFVIIQFALPLRHHTIDGNVLWTNEGHRLSWRMMLRSRSGSLRLKVLNCENNKTHYVKLGDYLSKKQQHRIATHPDMIYQFIQKLKKEYEAKGMNDIEIYAIGRVRVNSHPYKPLIDPEVDLTKVSWYFWEHNPWITDFHPKKQKK